MPTKKGTKFNINIKLNADMLKLGFIPVVDAARRLLVTPSTVCKWVDTGKVAGRVERRKWRFVSVASLCKHIGAVAAKSAGFILAEAPLAVVPAQP